MSAANGVANGTNANGLNGQHPGAGLLKAYNEDADTKSADACVATFHCGPDRTSDRDLELTASVYTTSNGVPVPHPYATQRAGFDGPLLLQDFHLIDLLSHFDRER
jgi:hypothetical protein